MNRIITFTFLFSAVYCVSAFAQSADVSEVKREIERGNSKAILEALSDPAKSQKADFRKFLESLAANKEQAAHFDTAEYFAQIALAKLGDRSATEQILSEVDSDGPVQLAGMKKLFLVGGKIALKKFYDLLDDSSQIEIKENCIDKSVFCNDVFFYPKNAMAVFYLSQIVDNPPTRRGVPSNQIPLWKDWFEKNKYLIADF